MKKGITGLALLMLNLYLTAQIVINEASNRNYTQVIEDDGNNYDWFEIYNAGATAINLLNWGITDSKNYIAKWTFPDITLKPGVFQLVYASGLNIKNVSNINHWESAVLPSDEFKYFEPGNEIQNWTELGFNDVTWNSGIGGFGYGDDDDNTITSSSSPVVYIRKVFNVTDKNVISTGVLNIDYDDGFVAYLNGIEIARANISGEPLWNSLAIGNHEAQIYQGGYPDKYILDSAFIHDILQVGQNILAIEVHNIDNSSSDLSLIPYLSFGILTSDTYFQNIPYWFSEYTGIKLHTNFKIDSQGEGLYLFTPGNVIMDSLIIPRLPLDYSIGKISDGAVTTGIFQNATPGSSNNSTQVFTNGYEPAPQFNVTAGFYNTSQNVTISTPSATSVIRYTLNGSEPTATSTVYNGSPISITSTKTLKAKCFGTTDKMPSLTTTATYFINVSHTIPVISISTNNENLYGSSGIFDNTYADWNKPCYIEYFDGDSKLAFKQEAGIQIDGGAGGSRTHPQHSVRIEPGNGTFGDGDVDYALIPDRPNREKYSSFYLRNGSNQYNTLQYKDGIQVKAIAKNTATYYSAYSAIVAYINGNYFGLYELREKLNADFFKENYLMDNDSLDLLSLSYYKGSILDALEGSTDQFWKDFDKFNTLSPTDNDYLSRVDSFLDINNYTDYIIAQTWIGNTDWPFNNIRMLRNKSTNYRWQFAVQDVEWSMYPNGWSNATDDHISYMLSQSSDIPYIGFWLGLMKNNNYKTAFINRYADLMNTNYLFSVIGPMEGDIYNYQLPEMQAEFSRWGNSNLSSFTSNHNTLRSQFSIRSDYARRHIVSHFNSSGQVEVTLDVYPEGSGQIKISTITPADYPWSGIYFGGIPVKITAIANPGYKFVNWDNNALIDNLENSSAIVNMSSDAETFTANFEASNDNFRGITISEIHYKNGKNENSSDWIELYNGSNTEVSLKGWYFRDNDTSHKFTFGDATIIEGGNRMVVARNPSNFRTYYPGVTNLTGPFSFKLGSPVDAVKLYNASDSLISEVNYSDIYPWPLNGDESGRTLELRDPAGNLSNPSNWFAGCIGGSPGDAYSYCPPVINNIESLAANEKPEITAYPVPANEFVNLKMELDHYTGDCIIRIYNCFGSELKTISYNNVEKGIFKSVIDLTGIPEGLLIFDIQTDQTHKSIKIIHLAGN